MLPLIVGRQGLGSHCLWVALLAALSIMKLLRLREKSSATQGVPAFPVLFPRFIDEESKVLRFNSPQIDH